MIKVKLVNKEEKVLQVSLNAFRIMHDVREENSFLTELVCEGSQEAIRSIQSFISTDDNKNEIKFYTTHGDNSESNVNLLFRPGTVESWILIDSNDTRMIITKRENFVGGPGADQIDPYILR